MTSDSQRDLEQLRRLLAEGSTERQQLLVGLSDALEERGAAATGARAEMVAAAESTDGGERAGVVEKLVATAALLYAPPAIAARVLLGQVGSVPPSTGGGIIP